MDEIKQHFEGFYYVWSIYPRKVGKKAAEAKFERLKVREKELICEWIKMMKKSEWSGKDIKYVPHLATAINQRRFMDLEDTTPDVDPLVDKNNDKPRAPCYDPFPEVQMVEPASQETLNECLEELKRLGML